MKEFLALAKEKFMEAKWYDKIWTIFLILLYITVIVMMVYFILFLFDATITIKVLFLFLWTVMMLVVGMLIGVTLD